MNNKRLINVFTIIITIALIFGLNLSFGGNVYADSAIYTFNYTGTVQTWTVPNGVSQIQVECWGSQGCGTRGKGGYTKGLLNVTPGQVLNIYAGGSGSNG